MRLNESSAGPRVWLHSLPVSVAVTFSIAPNIPHNRSLALARLLNTKTPVAPPERGSKMLYWLANAVGATCSTCSRSLR